MIEGNFYYTIQQPVTAEHKDRGSRFLAHAFAIQNANEAKEKLQQAKKDHPKASHHCFAYRLGRDGNNFRASDDGEPSGTAGKPILGQIDSRQLVNVMVVVVRYFGGTLLGVPGLINAYRTAASLVLQLTPTVKKQVMSRYRLSFDYTLLNEVMMIIKSCDCEIEEQEQSMFCSLVAAIPNVHLEVALERFGHLMNLEINAVKKE